MVQDRLLLGNSRLVFILEFGVQSCLIYFSFIIYGFGGFVICVVFIVFQNYLLELFKGLDKMFLSSAGSGYGDIKVLEKDVKYRK